MRLRLLVSIQIGIRSLHANPIRSVLSTLGVIIGVASLVAILSIGDTLERFSREQIEQTTDLQTIQVSPVTSDVFDGVAVRRHHPAMLTSDDAAALSSALAGRAEVGVMRTGSAWAHLDADTARQAVLVSAVSESAGEMGDAAMVAGRFVLDSDSAVVPVPAVVTSSLAEKLGTTPEQTAGRTLSVSGVELIVVGVVGGSAGSRAARVLVPFGVPGGRLSAIDGREPVATIRADRIEDVEAIREQVESWLEERYGAVERNFTISTSQARVQQASRAMLVFKLALGAIASISLLVGGIGIMNVLLASVSDRTREIGVRKATGARHRDVLVQFLAESVMISGVGALLGVVFGMVVSLGANAIIRGITDAPMKTTFTIWSILVATAAALVVGLVFGTYPARKAARLSASEAMRYE